MSLLTDQEVLRASNRLLSSGALSGFRSEQVVVNLPSFTNAFVLLGCECTGVVHGPYIESFVVQWLWVHIAALYACAAP